MVNVMNKAVFITGAQSGTGYGIAEFFAKQGWDVFITSRRGADAESSAKKLSDTYGIFSKGYECNIRNEQQVIDIFNDIDKSGRFVETVILNAANERNAILNRRLLNRYGLKTSFKRGVLFDILAVLRKSGCADYLNLASRKRRL